MWINYVNLFSRTVTFLQPAQSVLFYFVISIFAVFNTFLLLNDG